MRQSFLDGGIETVSFRNGGDAEIDGFRVRPGMGRGRHPAAAVWRLALVEPDREHAPWRTRRAVRTLTYISDYEVKSGPST